MPKWCNGIVSSLLSGSLSIKKSPAVMQYVSRKNWQTNKTAHLCHVRFFAALPWVSVTVKQGGKPGVVHEMETAPFQNGSRRISYTFALLAGTKSNTHTTAHLIFTWIWTALLNFVMLFLQYWLKYLVFVQHWFYISSLWRWGFHPVWKAAALTLENSVILTAVPVK